MAIDARKEEYEHVELFGKPALFTDSRISRFTVPQGWFCYDLRGSDYDPGRPIMVENRVVVNHAGSILTPTDLKLKQRKDNRIRTSSKPCITVIACAASRRRAITTVTCIASTAVCRK